jgi:formylglycine-generating enzyme required for sulfatase activity
VHSACRRLLDAWAIELPEISARQSPRPDDQWFLSPHGHTMIRIFPDQRYLSCPDTSAASRNLGIWISDAEVTVADFQRFVDDTSSPERQLLRRQINTVYEESWQPITDGPEIPVAVTAMVRSVNQPVMDVSVEDAILYCNWLSRREGLKSCYQRTDEILPYRGLDDWPDGYRCNVWLVDRCADGYRLPSDGICRFATAGGSQQKYPFGSNIQWFEEFAVVSPGSATGLARATSAPVRSRLPNNYGLFDMLANVKEWAHQHRRGWDPTDHKLSLSTPVHGQSWQHPVDQEAVRENRPTRDRIEVGFRIVRNMR